MSLDSFWDEHWSKRCDSNGAVLCNVEKFKFIVGRLWGLPWLIKATKFDVGCGPCNLARIINNFCEEWTRNYKGIDLSGKAISEAKEHGINAEVADLCSYSNEPDESYEIVLILDTLEHIEQHHLAAQKIRDITRSGSRIYGNIPLYFSDHSKTDKIFERPLDILFVKGFVQEAGFILLANHVYGIDGWPYMWFEAKRD